MRTFLYYSAGLIAVYLLVANADKAAQVIKPAADGVGGLVTAFQGR